MEGGRGVEHLRDQAVLLGFSRDAGEAGVIEVEHVASQGESRLAYLEYFSVRIQRDGSLCEDLLWIGARRLQHGQPQ